MAYQQKFPLLCRPLKVGRVTLRNRMCSAPMGFPDLTEDGCLTEGAIAFYENRAKGGAAVVTISEACVDYVHGKSHGRLINLQNPGVLAGLTNAARAISRHGALASIELNHSGMLSEFDALVSERLGDGLEHWGPVDTLLPNGTAVRDMSKAMIGQTVQAFAQGASLVKRAGFDMVMLHAGHGWLIHQFLSPLTNSRTDEYGGSRENRARLAVEILTAMRRAVGPDFPIEVRFSAMETPAGGLSLEDAIAFAKQIEPLMDILHVSAGTESDFHVTHPSMFAAPGCNVKYAAEIKKHVSVPVATLGALNEPEHMESILASGQADLVCMARALLADPELPKKVEQNREDEILRCIRCFVCHAERMLTQTRVCALNPEIGREQEAKFERPITAPKRVLIAGGGPGGMQAAVTAAKRGHRVTLCEKTDCLGGSLKAEYGLPFKAAFPKYVKTMARRMELAGVELRLNTEVTPKFVAEFSPDALLIAVGAEPLLPALPGMDKPSVIPATELHSRMAELGPRVAVLGGGLVGCESALWLADLGHQVTLIERQSSLAPDANPRHRPALMQQLAGKVKVLTDTRVQSITGSGVLCITSDGAELNLPADSMVAAFGMLPRESTVDSLRGTAPIVEIIGDCSKPGLIRHATFRGYHAALDL